MAFEQKCVERYQLIWQDIKPWTNISYPLYEESAIIKIILIQMRRNNGSSPTRIDDNANRVPRIIVLSSGNAD